MPPLPSMDIRLHNRGRLDLLLVLLLLPQVLAVLSELSF